MKGITYFSWRKGFSINEGEVPNIHMSWSKKSFMFYLRLPFIRWHFELIFSHI